MRANVSLMWILAAFFTLMAAVYTVWHMIEYDGAIEWAGTMGLSLVAIMGIFIGFYLMLVNRTSGGVLPEDREDALIDDGDPEQGHFSPWSWWPLVLAASAALLLMGVAINVFMIPIAGAMLLVALVGWVYEYYRGNFSR